MKSLWFGLFSRLTRKVSFLRIFLQPSVSLLQIQRFFFVKPSRSLRSESPPIGFGFRFVFRFSSDLRFLPGFP